MDIEQKKGEVKADIARGPENVVFSRIDICDEVQLADLMKAQFTPYFRDTAKVASSGTTGDATDTLHEVCINLAKQRALLQGAAVSDVINFSIAGTNTYTNSSALSLPDFTDSSYGDKTSFGFITLHDVNETGGSVTLSSTSNANTSITDNDGNAIKYFTDFSKYFLTRSRANGELISIDENTAPYTTPTIAEPFIPPNTINGEIFRGTAPAPTANSDVKYEFGTAANTSGGNAGGDLDIVENKWTGNTFVTIELSSVVGTFATSEIISDYDLNTATIKTYANTTTVFLEGRDSKGTFVADELVSDLSTNATISTITTLSDTEKNLTLTGSTFITGSNTDITLGFDTSNTISLDTAAVSRSGGTVTVIANSHGISPGERIALKGADTEYSEFNDTFIVEDTTANTLTFTTSNTTSVTPTGDFSLVDKIVFGRTSNASMSIFKRTANSSAQIVFQSDDLSAGFPVANTITGSSFGATGMINSRTVGGAWHQTNTNEVKTFFSNSTIGTWDYDATNNPVGIPAAANAGAFWLQNFEPVKINQIVAGTNAATSSETSPKMVLDIAIATTSDLTGGFDTTINTTVPGIYFAYPLKSYADQVHDGVTTLSAYDSFANVITAPEGLEVNFDWLPLSQNAAGNKTGADIAVNGVVANSAHIPDKVTTLNKANFEAHLGPYNNAAANPVDDVFRSCNPDRRSNGIKVNVTFPNTITNPFFPAVTVNTSFSATGYSAPAGANTANDIFAGSYTHVETGAVDPASKDYRYVVQNDLKWVYATNPFAAGGTASTSVANTPQAGAFLPAYDGEFDTEMDAVQDESADGTSGSVVMIIPENDDNIAANADGYSNSPQDAYRCDSNSGGVVQKAQRTVSRTGAGTLGDPYVYTLNAWGSWAEFPCFYNRVRHLTTVSSNAGAIGGTKGSYTVANMETNFGLLYQLLKNLENADYGKDFEDPLAPSTSGYATGQGDASFKQETEDLKSAMDDLIEDHNTEVGRTYQTSFAYSGTADNSLTHPNDYRTTYHANVITEVTSYRSVVKRRITEISNRIGFVNAKDVAGGGTTSSPAKASGWNTSNSTFSAGFTGYSFNGGYGYANTVYSHANFLAGKKINLLGKVLKAIVGVQEMYDSVTRKRSEYYEYNQAS